MKPKTIILHYSNKPELYSTFKSCCNDKGYSYQTLSNQKRVPKLNRPVEINNAVIHRLNIK